ncbi:MAG: hypothetical protein ACI956_002256, partial [Nonlabens sp.]
QLLTIFEKNHINETALKRTINKGTMSPKSWQCQRMKG